MLATVDALLPLSLLEAVRDVPGVLRVLAAPLIEADGHDAHVDAA